MTNIEKFNETVSVRETFICKTMITFILELAKTRTYEVTDEQEAKRFADQFNGTSDKTLGGKWLVTI